MFRLLVKFVHFIKERYYYAYCFEYLWNYLQNNKDKKKKTCHGPIIENRNYPCKLCPYYVEEDET